MEIDAFINLHRNINMFLRIDNAPNDVTEQEIWALFNNSPRVKNVLIKQENEGASVIIWVRLNVESRAVINGIADYMNHKHLRSHELSVSAPLFFNDPLTNESLDH
jgi:hypothetical protein